MGGGHDIKMVIGLKYIKTFFAKYVVKRVIFVQKIVHIQKIIQVRSFFTSGKNGAIHVSAVFPLEYHSQHLLSLLGTLIVAIATDHLLDPCAGIREDYIQIVGPAVGVSTSCRGRPFSVNDAVLGMSDGSVLRDPAVESESTHQPEDQGADCQTHNVFCTGLPEGNQVEADPLQCKTHEEGKPACNGGCPVQVLFQILDHFHLTFIERPFVQLLRTDVTVAGIVFWDMWFQ